MSASSEPAYEAWVRGAVWGCACMWPLIFFLKDLGTNFPNNQFRHRLKATRIPQRVATSFLAIVSIFQHLHATARTSTS